MQYQEKDSVAQINQFPFQSLKIQNQNTTISFRPKNITQISVLDFESSPHCQVQYSFQEGIYDDNVEILKVASIKYLQDCLIGSFDRKQGFKDVGLYDNLPFEVGGQDYLEILTTHNQLLSASQKSQFMIILREQDNLSKLIKQVIPIFGKNVGQQLAYIFYRLITLKLEKFRNLAKGNQSILPRFNCYREFEAETILETNCPVYQDLSLEEIGLFAEKELQNIYSNLYFQVKYLSLRQIRQDTKGSILSKFGIFLKQISRTLFFTLANACEPNTMQLRSLLSQDFSREVSLSEYAEDPLLLSKTFSRPYVPSDEDQNYDFISKKMKFN